MPDMPPQGQAPAQGGGQPPQGGGQAQGGQQGGQGQGGGIAQAIVQLDQMASAIAQAVQQNQNVSDDTKSAWQDALSALRKAEQSLVKDAGGGQGEGDNDGDEGSTTMEQGGKGGAVPMSHQSMRQ